MDFYHLQKTIKQRKQKNIQASEDVFDEAVGLAYANGIVLQRMPSSFHFQIIFFNASRPDFSPDYIYNLYPSTQRIYSDPKHRGPFLKIPKPWTLLDVVKAAVKI